MRLPPGFRFAGIAAGIRPGKPDVARFVSDRDAACVSRAPSVAIARELAKAIGGSHNLIAELFTDTGVGTLVRGES